MIRSHQPSPPPQSHPLSNPSKKRLNPYSIHVPNTKPILSKEAYVTIQTSYLVYRTVARDPVNRHPPFPFSSSKSPTPTPPPPPNSHSSHPISHFPQNISHTPSNQCLAQNLTAAQQGIQPAEQRDQIKVEAVLGVRFQKGKTCAWARARDRRAEVGGLEMEEEEEEGWLSWDG